MNYKEIQDPLKRAFFREAIDFIFPEPSLEQIEIMWGKWWKQHQTTPTNIVKRYYLNPKHLEWSIYDWNVDIEKNDWWNKNINK